MGYFKEYNRLDSLDSSFGIDDSSIAFGDIDIDGLDEIINIDNGDLFALNSNKTLVHGFPIRGDFYGVPLIANIMNIKDNKPEII